MPVSVIEHPSRTRGASFQVGDLHFGYPGGQPVFDRFSFDVAPGEFVAVLGPSGCGKSTLLNLLSGFLRPEEGRIAVDGTPVAPEQDVLGYVFQSPNLFPWLNVIENVRFGLRMAGKISKAEQYARSEHLLDIVGLADFAGKSPHHLSGGQRQRIALARALVLEPRLLLMDEPFSALDAITRAGLNDELLRLWAALGQTVVFITHDIDEAVYLADRVLVLGYPPTGIRAELIIDLPRPRDQHRSRSEPRFEELRSALATQIAAVTTSRSRSN
ncbi:ABC transporter ATP-binding protein [Rhizobium sp. HT1-10]|uniref:ABC transporter ATP-binding protein n=1 Tax=Rhizobium sp. HT1-10 TaxID=3111638 RepID=UPI003C14D9DD